MTSHSMISQCSRTRPRAKTFRSWPRTFMVSLVFKTKARSIHLCSSKYACVKMYDFLSCLLPVPIVTLMPGMGCTSLSKEMSRLTSITLPCISIHLPIYGFTKPSACASLYFSKNSNSFSGSISKNSRPLVAVEGEAPIVGSAGVGVGVGVDVTGGICRSGNERQYCQTNPPTIRAAQRRPNARRGHARCDSSFQTYHSAKNRTKRRNAIPAPTAAQIANNL